jgi:hypothetical protein
MVNRCPKLPGYGFHHKYESHSAMKFEVTIIQVFAETGASELCSKRVKNSFQVHVSHLKCTVFRLT